MSPKSDEDEEWEDGGGGTAEHMGSSKRCLTRVIKLRISFFETKSTLLNLSGLNQQDAHRL